jgi:peptidoglycan/xylan/chitin deacetylase (PgdA/CDA1 family)
MRGRVILIVIASAALAAAAGGSLVARRSSAQADVIHRDWVNTAALPTGCTVGGPPFRTHGLTKRKRIAIGFDDGPSDYTPKVLRVLRQFGAHATFFEIGQETSGRAETMKRILAQGNEIGNHTLHHEANPSSQSLAETNRLIRNATGFRPCDFRPPDGRVSPALIQRAKAEHLMTINWDVDPRDWADPGVSEIVSDVIRHARSGAIVVMHDGGGNRTQTVEALPRILSHFQNRGYQFVTVTDLLGHHFTY